MVRVKNLVFDIILAGFIFILALLLLSLSSCKNQPDVIPTPIQNTVALNKNDNEIFVACTCPSTSIYFQSVVLTLIFSTCKRSTCSNAMDYAECIISDSYATSMTFGRITGGTSNN